MSWKRILTTVDQQQKKQLNSAVKAVDSHVSIEVPVTSKPTPALLSRKQSITRSHDTICARSLSSLSSSATTNDSEQSLIKNSSSDKLDTTNEVLFSNRSLLLQHSSANAQNLSDVPYYSITQPNANDQSSLYYEMVLHRQTQEIQNLREDLTRLNEKYIQQIESRAAAEQARFEVEAELEDLSRRLFEEANEMVSKEKKALFIAEKKIGQLERTLLIVHEELNNERAQLKELRAKFEQQEKIYHHHHQQYGPQCPLELEKQQQTSLHSNNNSQECNETNDSKNETLIAFGPSSTSIPNNANSIIHLDNNSLNLFKDFTILAPKTPLDQIHRISFLIQCLDLDVEPCLRFGNVKCAGRLPMRKTLEAITHHPCYIEPVIFDSSSFDTNNNKTMKKKITEVAATAIPATTHRSSHDSRGSTGKNSPPSSSLDNNDILICHGCGSEIKYYEQQPLFRYRLKEFDTEWYWIDQACRDRLVAVCNFYIFVRNVRSGLRSRTDIQNLFNECLQLRLSMFWARTGVHYSHN